MSSFFQDFLSPLLGLEPIGVKFNAISGTLLLQLQDSLSNTSCTSSTSDSCRDDTAALPLKLAALVSILMASAAGITIPLLLHRRKNILPTNTNIFTAAKAFAAGVILATGFVHMLPDASENLTDTCLPKYPWRKFPFSGFIAMMSALVTLMADFLGTQFYESRMKKSGKVSGVDEDETSRGLGIGDGDSVDNSKENGYVEVSDGGESREGHVVEVYGGDIDHHGHSHSHGFVGDAAARNVVVAQVLELGIVSHSVMIGLSLGVSNSPCIIKPLIAALSFHQFFEGFALGGCIAKAHFKQLSTIIMACFFTFTTPIGIVIGIALASSYNPSSARALVFEGILDSISAGILIYMALVDLIAPDFMSNKMRSSSRLQVVCYLCLFFGALLMSALAIWA